jgi:hypothetical protein
MNEHNPNRRRRGGQSAAGLRLRARSTAMELLSLAVALACVMLLGAPLATAATSEDTAASEDAAAFSVEPLCATPAPGYSGCLGLKLSPDEPLSLPGTRAVAQTAEQDSSAPAAGTSVAAEMGLPPGEAVEHKTPSLGSLTPEDLLSAYGLLGAPEPSPQTIALVDAYNDPAAEADLEVFDEEFHLRECTAGNGCFEQVNQSGEQSNLPFPATSHQLKVAREGTSAERKLAEQAAGWAVEISTDIEVAHGVCPSCHILLVEANTNKNEDLYTAEQTAVALGAKEVSNSWGGNDEGVDYPQFNHPGVVITASAGDYGYLNWLKEPAQAAEYPASSPHVVAVGGTRLKLDPTTKARISETVWNDGGAHETGHGLRFEGHGGSGGGCSLSFEAQPWQQSLANWPLVGCEGRRGVADVSADGDPYTGVAIYDSTENEGEKGWATIGGTSVASPIIAATFALAGGAHEVAYPAQTLYENERSDPASLHDVELGSNGECLERVNASTGEASCTPKEEARSCFGQAICLAGPGYDGPSGVGTPNGLAAFRPPPEHGSEGAVTPAEGSGASPAPSGSSEPGTGAPAATASGPPTSPATAATPVISALKLTHAALAAVAHGRAKLAQLRFSFSSSASTHVRVMLSVRVRVHGRLRWRTISTLSSFLAAAGTNARKLSGRKQLAHGRYMLTLTPAHGAARSLLFSIA